MRLKYYITEDIITKTIDDLTVKAEKMSAQSMEYALKIGFNDLVDYSRKQGNETRLCAFVNKFFKCDIQSLDELDFARIQLRESISLPTINIKVIKNLINTVGLSLSNIKAGICFLYSLALIYGLK